MGTICAMLLCEKNFSVKMWGYDSEQLLEMKAKGENYKFLPGYPLPKNLIFEPDDSKILADANMIISATPCQFMRSIWQRLKPFTDANIPIVSVTKGIENNTLLRPSQILADVMEAPVKAVSLSGPTIADELARKLPATATAACNDETIAEAVQQAFNTSTFRVYRNTDIIGVELAGALKNIIAIAAGILDGIGAGDNAKAALLSRGLAEITRLGIAMGAMQNTFAGLSGLGDLVTTCISPKGRNRAFGQRIGAGMSCADALKANASIVEGVPTCKSVIGLAKKCEIEMPITEAVFAVLFSGTTVENALAQLMTRQLKAE
ncbi:MAG: NAD(P)-dependent glycerol-3-phosphate dehydrogenase [Anaerohalosphaeraceae bacterium]|nr:NAD(P)-dependent glycerol-3-phosphate dehydrogenase [Anaerohalosphaeraceae bacterium]